MNKKDKVALVQKLRFPEFKNNSAINLENGNVIFESISNKNHNSDLPVLAITQEHGAIPREQINYNVSVTDKSLESYKVVEIGDFIISLRSFQGGIEYSLYHGICSPAYIILRKKTPIVEQYYKYYFKTNKFIQDINKDLEGIRDGKMVSYSQFSSILLPKPENKEQQKIAECLSSIDDLITAEDKKLEALKAHKKGLMQKLFTAEGEAVPECRFPEFRSSGKWNAEKIGDLCKIIGGGTPSTQKSDYWCGEYPWISSSDLTENDIHKINITRYISKDAIINSATKIVEKNSVILVSRVGVGKVAINDFQLCTSQDFANLTEIKGISKFFAYYMSNKMLKEAKNYKLQV